MIGERQAGFIDRLGRRESCEKFGDVPGERRDPRGLFGVGGIVAEKEAVILDHSAAAGRRDDDGVEAAALDLGGPDIDIVARLFQASRSSPR